MKKISLYFFVICVLFVIFKLQMPDKSFEQDKNFFVYENIEKYKNHKDIKDIKVSYYSISGLGQAAIFKDIEKDVYYHLDINTLTSDKEYKQIGDKKLENRDLSGVFCINSIVEKNKIHLNSTIVDVYSFEIHPLKFEKIEYK